jgi:flagellar secretion chaperone FliS
VSTTARNAYRQMSLETASPATVIVMLYDRLVRDMTEALDALELAQVERAHHALKRCQELVWGLDHSLDVKVWPEGNQLHSLYQWFTQSLVEANLTKRAEPVRSCLPMVMSLADAWRQAAVNTASSMTSVEVMS